MEDMMMRSAASVGADLLMECDEEEQEVWPQSPESQEKQEEEGPDEAVLLMEGEEMDPPVRIIPIPVPPVSSCISLKYNNTHGNTVKCSRAPLCFKVNGLLVPLPPGGAQLKLHTHPRGSACGFTTVHLPVTLTFHSPTGTACSTTAPSVDSTPIITGVVSGEAAQKVLSNHNVNFKSSPPLTGLKTPPCAPVPPRASPLTLSSPQTSGLAPHSSRPPPGSSNSSPTAPLRLLQKGQLGPVSPPDCLICKSKYKLIMELRGFMCLCSPAITQSLKNLKKTLQRRSRDRNRMSSKVSRARPGLSAPQIVSAIQRTHRPSDDVLSDQFSSPCAPSTTCSPQQVQSESPPDPPHGKLVIMVEDFYYGSTPGRSSVKASAVERKFSGPYRCIHCPKMLRNNIKLMSHMQQHVSTMCQQDGRPDALSSCPHCFRRFLSPFKLQCHLEAVHSQYESTARCRICDLQFGSEPDFLWHMKSTHKPGEMPYVCQVCDFRSSFYSDVWSHFEEVHADSKHLLCQYCLRVLRSNTCYQQHFARHQKKHVFSCDKCRLHFLFVKERVEHKVLHHRTYITPPQLTGLRPGTKVTVRTYSVVGGSQNEDSLKQMAPCKVVDVEPPPPTQEATRRKAVESLGPLLSNLSQDSEAAGRPSHCCVECLSSFKDFTSHFPSVVHCSLCRFITCCSLSYANHMINNHAACRQKPQYYSMFQSELRLSHALRCVSCTFTTCKGDVMANHLTERPEHHCVMLTHTEPSVETTNTQSAHNSCRSTDQPVSDPFRREPSKSLSESVPSHAASSVCRGGGAFIPIHLLPSSQTFTQLSVKALTSPSPLSSPPAMTIRFLGPNPQPEQCSVYPLTASQLSVVLFSLCHGLHQASCQYRTSPQTIRSWTRQQERHLLDRKWFWKTEKLAEWLLCQREQQLNVSEDVLLQTARRVLGEDSQLVDCYSWTVDFLLRHDLSVQPVDSQHYRGRLPRNIRDNSCSFIHLLSAQIHSKPPHLVASMDELSIFVDLDQFSQQKPLALRLFGSSEDKAMFDIVLSALSDGTFLPPLLLFRGTPSHVPEGFPENVLLEAQQEGFTDEELLRIWIDKVWHPRVSSQRESVLIVDVHRSHLAGEFRSSLTSMSTNVFFIPSGCSCRLQPLNVCVTPALRDFLQTRWSQLVSQGGLDSLGLDQLALTLACWLSEVTSILNSDTHILNRSFASVCNQQQVEDRGEAAKMIQVLSEALLQPPETSELPPDSEPQLELLLVMEDMGKAGREDKREDGGTRGGAAAGGGGGGQ